MRPARTRFKICCIKNVAEAEMAIRYGASAVGLVSAMPSGPGVIAEDDIAAIARTVPPGVATFLLTSKQDVGGIIAQQKRCEVNTLQLCDSLHEGAHAELREALPGIGLVQVIHVTGPESLDHAIRATDYVDALLLDSGQPNAKIKELGGTGRTHDWTISQQIRQAVDVPVFLAGGLNPTNVAEAIAAVEPYAVDICSGVRTNDELDERKLAAFASAAR